MMSNNEPHIFVTPFERNRKYLSDILNQHNLTGYGVEIGVKQGIFSKHLLSTVNFTKLYLVDPWSEQDLTIYDESHHDHKNDF